MRTAVREQIQQYVNNIPLHHHAHFLTDHDCFQNWRVNAGVVVRFRLKERRGEIVCVLKLPSEAAAAESSINEVQWNQWL